MKMYEMDGEEQREIPTGAIRVVLDGGDYIEVAIIRGRIQLRSSGSRSPLLALTASTANTSYVFALHHDGSLEPAP